MADYNPTAGPTFDAVDEEDQNGEDRPAQLEAGEEDDDYDPSRVNFDDSTRDDSVSAEISASVSPPVQNEQPTKPKTVGGFMLESDDEEEDAPPPQLRLNGAEGALSDVGTAAVSEGHHDTIRSEPQDTAATVQTAQNASLNGSTPVVPPVSDVTSSFLATPLQSAAADQGNAISPAVQSAAATPVPAANVAAVPPVSLPPTSIQQRLPHDKVGQLEDRIKDDPKADSAAWRTLITHYREKGQLDNARRVYSRFFEVFPTAASMWVEYVQMELEQNELRNVEQIFTASLRRLPNVDMWNTYLDYLRRIYPLINDADGVKRGYISSAFEVLLDNVGIDPDAGKLWRDFIDFAKSGPGVVGGSGWQDAQKMDLLRKAYQRAVKIPHSELTKVWKEYDNFELGLNKATGRKYLQEQSPHYMTARTAKTQLDSKIEGLDRSSLPILPPLYGCVGDDQFATQVEKWRAWIEWEKEDPLVLKDEDLTAYRKRVIYAFKQATMQLRFYPEIWYEAASWCFDQGTEELTTEGESFLDEGVQACPESVLLALKKADRVETGLETGNTDEVMQKVGEKLDVPFENVHKPLYALMKKMQERMNAAVSQVTEDFDQLAPEEEAMALREVEDDDDGSRAEKPKTREEEKTLKIEEVQREHKAYMDVLKRAISHVWVAKMRAFRRVQDQGNPKNKARKGFRGVFAEARPRGQLTGEVYIASALMEWHCYKDPSATKIFDRGLRLFKTDEIFTLEYIKHLVSKNDDVNARAVFETTITKIMNDANIPESQKLEKCRPLFAYMHDYESNYGDLTHIHRLEKRMAEMYPMEPDLERFGRRFASPTFDATQAQLVISPTQALPKREGHFAGLQQSVTSALQPHSPAEASHIRLGPNGPYIPSPKRPLDDSDNDTPQRKFMRGESPLKGAAGRRIQSQATNMSSNTGGGSGFVTKSFVPNNAGPPFGGALLAPTGPTPLPNQIAFLLSIIPSADKYDSTIFDAPMLVEYIKHVNLEQARR